MQTINDIEYDAANKLTEVDDWITEMCQDAGNIMRAKRPGMIQRLLIRHRNDESTLVRELANVWITRKVMG